MASVSSILSCRTSYLPLPFFPEIQAGFPSPAEDYVDCKLDLNEKLIAHPSATFFVKVKGYSMQNAGVHEGDMLIVDRALDPKNGDIVVAFLNGEYTVKRYQEISNKFFLLPENADYSPIEVTNNETFEIWGVVTYVIHKLSKR